MPKYAGRKGVEIEGNPFKGNDPCAEEGGEWWWYIKRDLC